MTAAPPTPDDADTIARFLVTHLWHTIGQALIDHEPGRMDAEDFQRFLHGEWREKVAAIEQRIASLLPPLHPDDAACAADAEIRRAAGKRTVRAYLRRAARAGEFVRTTAGVRRVVE